MKRQFFPKQHPASGQTLIETLAGIFVLAMGITAVLGLATFSLSSSTNITKQVIGIGLARQGIEAVKNMRDTNWLWQTTIDSDCYNYKNGLNTATCYRSWLNNPSAYSIAPQNSNSYVLAFTPDPADNKFPSSSDIVFWHLMAPPISGYTLYYYPYNPANPSATKFFYDPILSASATPSGFYRKITITQEGPANTPQAPKPAVPPFDKTGIGPYIRVISQVWWADKNCPTPDKNTYPTSGSCRISLETVLTNWKTN